MFIVKDPARSRSRSSLAEAAVPRHLAPSLDADPGVWHNSVNACAGPGVPVNIINSPWLVLAQNNDKWAASVSPGRENHVWATVVASVFSVWRRLGEPGVRSRTLSSWAAFRRAVGCGTGTGSLPHPVFHPLFCLRASPA